MTPASIAPFSRRILLPALLSALLLTACSGDDPQAMLASGKDYLSKQDTNAALPWTKDVQISGLGKFVSLTATNDFDASGSITCTIKQGEKVISTNTSSGPAATASCSGTAD